MRFLRVSFALTIAFAAVQLHPQIVRDHRIKRSDELNEGMIRDTEIHLPANQTIDGLAQLQKSSFTHNLVQIEWDVLPGAPREILSKDAGKWPSLGTLLLKGTVANLAGPVGKPILLLPDAIWAFGLDESNEIHSFVSLQKPRTGVPEGGGAEDEVLHTKINLDVRVPNDKALTKIAIYESILNSKSWSLKLIGMISLPAGSNEDQRTSALVVS